MTKSEKRCMVCGRLIPEERYICILCEGVNEMQTFRVKNEGKNNQEVQKECKDRK